MSESRKIQSMLQSPQLIRQPIDSIALMRRYDNIAEHRQRLLNYQRVKVPPSELVKLKLKKKARKSKRVSNLKGEVAKNIREQIKFEKGQKRDKPEQDIRIVGEPPVVNVNQQAAPGGMQFDPEIERQKLLIQDRTRIDSFNLRQAELQLQATQYDINRALAERDYDLQENRLRIEDGNKRDELRGLFDRQQEERRQFDELQRERRDEREENLRIRDEEFARREQAEREAREQFDRERVIRAPDREPPLEVQTRFIQAPTPFLPPPPETDEQRQIRELREPREADLADPEPELARQAERVQATIDSRLSEFGREEEQRRAQREAQFLERGLSQVDSLITQRFSELQEREEQARRAAIEPDLSEEEQQQIRDRIYGSILEGIEPQGILGQQIEQEVDSAAQDLREAQQLENRQLRAEVLQQQEDTIPGSEIESRFKREQAERLRLEERLRTIETDVASITPRSTPASSLGTDPQDRETEFEEIRRSEVESSSEGASSSPSELQFDLEQEQEQPSIATQVVETLNQGRELISGLTERRPEPGQQTGGALVDQDGNPIYGLGQDFPEEFQDEIDIAEADLAAKQRSEEEQQQILAAADAAQKQRDADDLRKRQEAQERARKIEEAQAESERRNRELEEIRNARIAQERKDLEERSGVLPEPSQEPVEQVRRNKPPTTRPKALTAETVRQNKPPPQPPVEPPVEQEQLTPLEKARKEFKTATSLRTSHKRLKPIPTRPGFATEKSKAQDKTYKRAGGLKKLEQLEKVELEKKEQLERLQLNISIGLADEFGNFITPILKKPKRIEEVSEPEVRRAQTAGEGEGLLEEAQGQGTEPQSAVRTNFTTYQTLLPEIQQLQQVGRPKARRQNTIYIQNTSDKKLKGIEPGAEVILTGYESQNQGTIGFFVEGMRKRTQKNIIEKLIKEGKIKIYKK